MRWIFVCVVLSLFFKDDYVKCHRKCDLTNLTLGSSCNISNCFPFLRGKRRRRLENEEPPRQHLLRKGILKYSAICFWHHEFVS